MRKLGLGLCLGMILTGAAAKAEGLEAQAQFRMRVEDSERTDLASRRTFSLLRARVDLKYAPTAQLRLFAQPQFARTLGESPFVGSSASANAETQASGGTYDPAVGLHQGWAEYGEEQGFQARLGRQTLSYGDELVVGALEWNNTGRAFDGVRLRHAGAYGFTDLFATKLVETFTSGDADFFGLYAGTKKLGPFDEADLYVLGLMDGRDASGNLRLWNFGARVKSAFDRLDVRAEADVQTSTAGGTSRDAHQFDVEAGWSLGQDMPRLGAGVLSATTFYNQLFPTAHKWLGVADLFGRRNVESLFFNAGGKLGGGWGYRFELQSLRRFSDEAAAFKVNGSSALGSAAASQAMGLGTELDLTASLALTPEITASGGGGVLLPGDYLKDQFGDNPPAFFYIQLEVRAK